MRPSRPRRTRDESRRDQPRHGGGPAGARSKPPYDQDGIRLQKVLAEAGLGSRRAAEAMITAGRVKVDGVRVRELGLRVDPTIRRVEVDGLPIESDPDKITVALNKPAGVVSAMQDPDGRPTLAEYVSHRPERLFHVGRLDLDSEGLILLTNDGALANALSHPAAEVSKTYLATVEGRVSKGVGASLRRGIELEDGPATVDQFRLIDSIPGFTQVEVQIHSGRNRVIRRILDEVGHPVTRLVRTRIGPIALGDLKLGRTRVLSATEVASLKKAAGL